MWLTLATTVFLIGLLEPVRDATAGYPVVAVLGFFGMAASVAGWIRQDVDELSHKPFTLGHSEYLAGTIVLILSEIVIFGVLFFFYFWSRAHTTSFVPEQILHMDMTLIVANTVVLLSSGATVHMAQINLKKGAMGAFRVWLGLTILLGVAFVGGQVFEYRELVHEGLTPQTGPYGTAFFSLTGVHGLHVVAGIVALTIIWALSFKGFIRKERASGVEGAFIYWHFVDAIWILVFSFVYLRVV
ncbi:MAG TPA: heme-copper oxidase subunit III [Candidatus Thermoplasmatota archaeon]|nr:heme-copper oxidase subunit III [Candidatus Thermoplasmatota archaeon]